MNATDIQPPPTAGRVWQTITVAQRAADSADENLWLTAGYFLASMAGVALLLSFLGMALIYIERKVAAHFQCRVGPMRVGPFGLLQTVADTVKLVFKEDFVPRMADRWLHMLAPFLALLVPVVLLALIPYSPAAQVADLNIGILFITAIGGFGVMGILIAGWSSNNKWSMIGAMRAGAQIISYELSATLALLVVVLFSGTMSLSGIVHSQESGWWIWRGHAAGLCAFLIYLVASTAELNRTPFDIPEGESELTAGFHTEYSGLRFAFFFLAEFINMFTVSALTATLFLGGWMPFHIGDWSAFNASMDAIPPALWFIGKTTAIIFIIMWFRWTFPRLRVDQLMHLEWKVLLPIGFANLLVASVVVLTNAYPFPVAAP
ncbi:MAG: NADH-quinone oxidoreductase subunit NuoH [Candidatus Hydrogenedentes bacterium]|nr:NADH-quinone oxidoreductase subunit NuoH [Candidatus Hydrogenedentota bacterium]